MILDLQGKHNRIRTVPMAGWIKAVIDQWLAVAGIVFKLFFTGRFRVVSTAIYIAMGWLVLIAVGPLMTQLTGAALGRL